MIFDPIDRQAFRRLMRNVPTLVSVVAAGAPGERKGLTASAVCSLTDQPPTILVCINRAAGAHDVIIENGYFSVNLLAAGQEEIAHVFSGLAGVSGEARFKTGAWTAGATGAPVLASAVCHLECRLAEAKAGFSHTVFFGEIVGGAASAGLSPLVYLRGAYATLDPEAEGDDPVPLAADRPL